MSEFGHYRIKYSFLSTYFGQFPGLFKKLVVYIQILNKNSFFKYHNYPEQYCEALLSGGHTQDLNGSVAITREGSEAS